MTISILFFGGFIYILWNSYLDSPDFDPVTFDLSDRRPDGSSENNPSEIFYVPARYWGGFINNYKEDHDYLAFRFDLSDFKESNLEKMKTPVYISLLKPGYGAKFTRYIEKLKTKKPDKTTEGIKIYSSNFLDLDEPMNTYLFKGYDNQDVVIEIRPSYKTMSGYRRINSSIELQYLTKIHNDSSFFDLDKKITTLIREFQEKPSAFISLK